MFSHSRRVYFWVLLFSQFISLIYLMVTGQIHNVFAALLPISLLVTIVFVVISVMDRSIEGRKIHLSDVCIFTLKSFFSALCLVFTMEAFFFAAKDVIFWAFDGPNISFRTFVGTVFVLTIAIAAYLARRDMRSVFGFVEVALGLAFAYYRISSVKNIEGLSNSDLIVALTTASIFLIVRGLDNFYEGLKPDNTDLVFAYGRRFLKSRRFYPWPDELFDKADINSNE